MIGDECCSMTMTMMPDTASVHHWRNSVCALLPIRVSRPCCPRRTASLAASLVASPASTGPTRGPFRNNPPGSSGCARPLAATYTIPVWGGGYVHREAGKQQHTHHDPGGGRTGARSKHAVRDARIQTTHNAHRCASVDRAKYVHHTEMQHSFGLHETQTTLASECRTGTYRVLRILHGSSKRAC